MELPADVEYVEDANLFIWRPRGVLSEALVNKIIVFVREQEDTLGRSFKSIQRFVRSRCGRSQFRLRLSHRTLSMALVCRR